MRTGTGTGERKVPRHVHKIDFRLVYVLKGRVSFWFEDCGEVTLKEGDGIVRLTGRDLADQIRSLFSRGELTPFSEGGGAVLLKDFASIEVTVVVEKVVDRGVDGGELLQGLDVPEFRHRSLSSSKWLV